MAVTSSYIPPVNTLPHGGQIIVHFPSQHTTTWRSDHRAFPPSTHYHTAVRPSCIPPVNTLPHGGQIIVHSPSQHTTTWRSDHRAFPQSTHYHVAVRSSYIPPVNTLPHGGQIESLCRERPGFELNAEPSMEGLSNRSGRNNWWWLFFQRIQGFLMN